MRRDTTIWACPEPNCDNWKWGSIDDQVECDDCGAEMESDQQAALDTYHCERYHQQAGGI